MTLESTTVKKSYAGDDSTVAFPTTFIFWDITDIEVILLDALGVETTWVEGTQYDLTGGAGALGTVTVKTTPTDYTPATGETLLIRSNRDDIQDDALPLGGAFPSITVEQALDQLTRLIQQRSEEIDRAVLLAKTSELDQLILPAPLAEAHLAWNTAGTGLENAVPLAGSVILNDNDLGTSQTQATSQNSVKEYVDNSTVTMANKTLASPVVTGGVKGGIVEESVSGEVWNCKKFSFTWDMDADASVPITTGITNSKIRNVYGVVTNNAGTTQRTITQAFTNIGAIALEAAVDFSGGPTGTQLTAHRTTAGLFDDPAWNNSSGFIAVTYAE